MAVWDYKSVLAHELGHAVNDDHFINHLRFNARQEQRADEYAAELLINPQQLHDLALWHRKDLNSLTADLEVTPHLLAIYLNTHPLELKEETA